MKARIGLLILAMAAAGLHSGCTGNREPTPTVVAAPQTATSLKPVDHTADRDAIRQAAREFAQAFERGDAKTIAAQWTDDCIYHGEEGELIRGRANLEKAFAEHFKLMPKGKIDVEVTGIDFPSRDVAVEDGILQASNGRDLPASTYYSTIHVREDGKWKIAVSREWGANDAKLRDIAWLVGQWSAGEKDVTINMNVEWNESKTMLRNRYSVKVAGKATASGMQMIGADPVTGGLRSWHFDDDGGRGEAIWHRDGNSWIQESMGVSPDGAPTTAVNILTRLNDDAYLWRSVDRTIDGRPGHDTVPVKVTRVKAAK